MHWPESFGNKQTQTSVRLADWIVLRERRCWNKPRNFQPNSLYGSRSWDRTAEHYETNLDSQTNWGAGWCRKNPTFEVAEYVDPRLSRFTAATVAPTRSAEIELALSSLRRGPTRTVVKSWRCGLAASRGEGNTAGAATARGGGCGRPRRRRTRTRRRRGEGGGGTVAEVRGGGEGGAAADVQTAITGGEMRPEIWRTVCRTPLQEVRYTKPSIFQVRETPLD
jgi:hypothetical protein